MSQLKTIEVIQRRYLVEVYPPDSSVQELDIQLPSQVSIVMVGTQGPAGPAGEQGPQGDPGEDGAGGLVAVEDDPEPALGGDLDLGSYNINGQLETPGLIIDGGLL